MKRFSAAKRYLGDLDTEAAADLVAATSDIALIVDKDGVIRDVACGSQEFAAEIEGSWLGQPWQTTVTAESRREIQALLEDASDNKPSLGRQVTHSTLRGNDVPVVYSVVRVGSKGRVVAVGRDLSAMAVLQRRLVDAQQHVDREYARLRTVETRNRLLFQLASEAVLIVDAVSLRIVEANPAATQLLGLNARRISSRSFPEGFTEESTLALTAMVANVRAGGRSNNVHACRADGRDMVVSASVFREDRSTFLLLRATPVDTDVIVERIPSKRSRFADLVEASPDGYVVADDEGKVLVANPAFLDLAQLPNEESARGESLDRWLGRPGVGLNVLLAQLREHGTVRVFATTIRASNGTTYCVEISGAVLPDIEPPCYGFSVRDVGSRLCFAQRSAPPLSRSVEQLTELVGRVPLKRIVRETTDNIERLCIEAALELTQDNRASAAEMLGLSRQSLYVKLRRYGLGDLVDSEGDSQLGAAP